MGAFASKKSFISKLKNITTVTSVKTANLTRVRITMASPMQSGAGIYCLASIVFFITWTWAVPKLDQFIEIKTYNKVCLYNVITGYWFKKYFMFDANQIWRCLVFLWLFATTEFKVQNPKELLNVIHTSYIPQPYSSASSLVKNISRDFSKWMNHDFLKM